jgi:hypothetical protein
MGKSFGDPGEVLSGKSESSGLVGQQLGPHEDREKK